MDRLHPFSEECLAVVVSPQGCGLLCSHPLTTGTPVMLGSLPGGGNVSARVVNCLALGSDGRQYLVGASLYTFGNCWGITNPPADWADADSDTGAQDAASRKDVWPYNRFSPRGEAHPGRR